MKHFIWLFCSIFWTLVPAHGESDTKTIFGLPLKPDVTVNDKTIGDFIPLSVFQVRKSMTPLEVAETLIDFETNHVKGHPILSKTMGGTTPESAYLESLIIDWEKGRIQKLNLYAIRLSPSEGRVKRWITELRKILGEPHMAFRKVSNGREDPRTLILEWRNQDETFRLGMESHSSQYKRMHFYFDYYPGPDNPALPRINRPPPKPIPFDSLDDLLGEFNDEIEILPPGDGPHPPLKVPEGEVALITSYRVASAASRNGDRDAEQYWKPYVERLTRSLNGLYSDKSKPELFEHLVQIAEGEVRGLGSGAAQVGAASFLAGHNDPEVIDYLLRGMKVELPSGVGIECAEGIARQCSGKLMDRVIGLFIGPDEDRSFHAAQVLTSLGSKRQVKELKSKTEGLDQSHRERIEALFFLLSRKELDD